METALKVLLPRMIVGTDFEIRRFQCKDDLLKYMVSAECQEVFISLKSLWFNNVLGFKSQFETRTHADLSPGAGFRPPVFGIETNLSS